MRRAGSRGLFGSGLWQGKIDVAGLLSYHRGYIGNHLLAGPSHPLALSVSAISIG